MDTDHNADNAPLETMAERNAKHFDIHGPDGYKNQCIAKIQDQQRAFLESVDCQLWLGLDMMRTRQPSRMLDYACGSGMVSECFRPFFDECVGVDVSEKMLDEYRIMARRFGLDNDKMWCVKGDLLSSVDSPALRRTDLQDFDLIVVAMALHHVEDAGIAVKELANRLRVGGRLMIIDWAETSEDGTGRSVNPHEHSQHIHSHPTEAGRQAMLEKLGPESQAVAHTVSHGAFSEEAIHTLYTEAGCVNCDIRLATEKSDLPNGRGRLFFSRADKMAF